MDDAGVNAPARLLDTPSVTLGAGERSGAADGGAEPDHHIAGCSIVTADQHIAIHGMREIGKMRRRNVLKC